MSGPGSKTLGCSLHYSQHCWQADLSTLTSDLLSSSPQRPPSLPPPSDHPPPRFQVLELLTRLLSQLVSSSDTARRDRLQRLAIAIATRFKELGHNASAEVGGTARRGGGGWNAGGRGRNETVGGGSVVRGCVQWSDLVVCCRPVVMISGSACTRGYYNSVRCSWCWC